MSSTRLKGRRVLLTRPEGSAAAWRSTLEAAGASVDELPLIAVHHEADATVLREVLDGIGEYEWIVFTSANGVRGFFERFLERYTDIRSVGGVRFACVGPATEAALRAYHLDSDLTPREADGVGLARTLMTEHDVEHQKVLVVSGNLATDELPRLLSEQGHAIVDKILVYSTGERDVSALEAAASFRREGADLLVFASPSAVESFLHQAASLRLEPGARQPIAVAVGSTTAEAMRRAGIPVGAIAAKPSAEGIRDAAAEALASAKR
ncbi:MAG: uroporphyrinogen-III synthase [Opitutia bacterium]|jgi:uroporphyrinogen-III synthase